MEKESNNLEFILKKAVEAKFIKTFVEEMPLALEQMRRNEKELIELKSELKNLHSRMDSFDERMKKEGCVPVQNHLKMHNFVNWLVMTVVPMVVTTVLWLLGYIH